jgi:hypothetical protein
MSGCAQTLPTFKARVHATNIIEQFLETGGFQPGVGLDKIRIVVKRKSVSTAGTAPTFTFKPAYRLALVRPDNPGSWSAIAGQSGWTGSGEGFADIDVSSLTTGQAGIQFGISYQLSGTSPTDGQADLEVTISYISCGTNVGTVTQELNTFNTTTNTNVAITGWLPTLGVDYVVAFFMIAGLANNLRLQLCYRTATTSFQAAGAWTLLEGASYRTADGETSTTQLSMSLTTVMWVQFGIAYSQSSAGAAPGTATVTTTTWVRKS